MAGNKRRKQKQNSGSAEIFLYQMLGIRCFQKLVFRLEKWRRRKDGGQNSNYHLYGMRYDRISRHFAFLTYNALIHLTGLAACAVLLSARRLSGRPWNLTDWLILVAAVANIYCLMLQRYNFLRLCAYRSSYMAARQARIQRRAAALFSAMPPEYETETDLLREDLDWLEKLRAAISTDRDFIIEEVDACRMKRLAAWADSAGLLKKTSKGRAGTSEKLKKQKSFHPGSSLYSGTEHRVDNLQFLLRKRKNSILAPYSIVTAGAESERTFSELFPIDTSENILEVTDTFLSARP